MKTSLVVVSMFAVARVAAAEPAAVVGASAEPRVPLQLAVDLDTLWRLDHGYRLFSTSRTASAAGVSAAYDVSRLGARGTLALVAGWQSESSETGGGAVAGDDPRGGAAVASGPTHASFGADVASVGAVLRYRVLPWFEPHARVAVGGAWGDVAVTLSDGTRWSGHAWSPQASAGAGFRLRTTAARLGNLPGKPALAGAVAAEGGFIAGAPMSFSVRPPAPADAKVARDQIALAPVDIGKLDRSHPYLRLTLALLF